MFKVLRLLLAFGVTVPFAAACGGVDDVSANGHIQAKYDDNGRLEQLFYDRNKNGRVDTVAFMDGARFVRIDSHVVGAVGDRLRQAPRDGQPRIQRDGIGEHDETGT